MDQSQLLELINAGKSTYQIASFFETSQTNVRYWIKKYNLKTKHLNTRIREGLRPLNNIDRQCSKCKEIKALDQFYLKQLSRGSRHHPYCKSCLNITAVIRLQQIKIKCIDYKGGECCRCGYNKYYGALEFHHKDSAAKDFSISTSCKSFEKIKSELDKCDLVCANCHREIHAELHTSPRSSNGRASNF